MLLVLAVLLVMLSTAAVLHYVFDQFDDYGEALWSAAVHLVDPGALVEDEDAPERAMGMFQAIAGLVLLIGLLFELVSETVSRSIERLGRYDPPVHARDHLLIVGGGELLGEAAGALALATEVGERNPHVVVVAPEAERQSRRRILEEMREGANGVKIELVFGDTGDDSGFALGAAADAATILILPSSSGPVVAEAADVEVMQTGLALREYLAAHDASPEVRMLFRRGRNVDAVWGQFPPSWDAIVGDRTVASVLRHAFTGFDGVPELAELIQAHGSGDRQLLRAARKAADAAGRPLRLAIVGCGINAPALMEDLAEAGPDRFEVTMLAAKAPFDAYIGRPDPAGLALHYRQTSLNDPEELQRRLGEARPDAVLVTPSPMTWDLRDSDAEATLAVLHVLRMLPADTPVVAELFLPESATRLPADRRLLTVAVLEAVAGALALSVFNPERAQVLQQKLEAEAGSD